MPRDVADPVNPPSTEAGRALVEHHAMIRMGKRWDHMLVIPQEIAKVLVPEIEEQARAEGRREALDVDALAQAMTEAPPASRPGIYAEAEVIAAEYGRIRESGTSIDAHWRETVERYASESGQPPEASDE